MVGVSASVNLPSNHKVQKFNSGTGTPGWSRKKGHKTVVVAVVDHEDNIADHHQAARRGRRQTVV